MKISTRCENSYGLHVYNISGPRILYTYRVALAAMLCDMDNMISFPFVIVGFRSR